MNHPTEQALLNLYAAGATHIQTLLEEAQMLKSVLSGLMAGIVCFGLIACPFLIKSMQGLVVVFALLGLAGLGLAVAWATVKVRQARRRQFYAGIKYVHSWEV